MQFRLFRDITKLRKLVLILFDEKNERDKYNINIYYEDLLIEKDYGDIKFLHNSKEKIVIQDIKVKKKLEITKESIGNIEELVKNNSNLTLVVPIT